jgi:hypothetical protein
MSYFFNGRLSYCNHKIIDERGHNLYNIVLRGMPQIRRITTVEWLYGVSENHDVLQAGIISSMSNGLRYISVAGLHLIGDKAISDLNIGHRIDLFDHEKNYITMSMKFETRG